MDPQAHASDHSYEEELRTIGRYIDEHQWKEVCILEVQDGILVRGLDYTARHTGHRLVSESCLFDPDTMLQLEAAARRRRRAPPPPGAPAPQSPPAPPAP